MATHRKSQKRSEIEISTRPGYKNRENLPEKKNPPKEQRHPLETALRKKGIGAGVKCETQSDHQDAAEDASDDHSDQVETIVFLAHAVAQNSPAKCGNLADLLEEVERLRYISHESSSSCGRSVPSWRTTDKQICSSVVLSPASTEIPARNSSREPWATSRPL